jgi:hypothetical protein
MEKTIDFGYGCLIIFHIRIVGIDGVGCFFNTRMEEYDYESA